ARERLKRSESTRRSILANRDRVGDYVRRRRPGTEVTEERISHGATEQLRTDEGRVEDNGDGATGPLRGLASPSVGRTLRRPSFLRCSVWDPFLRELRFGVLRPRCWRARRGGGGPLW